MHSFRTVDDQAPAVSPCTTIPRPLQNASFLTVFLTVQSRLFGSICHVTCADEGCGAAAGNILVRKGAEGDRQLVPIDHGYILPDSFQDISFEWLYWPQARSPFGAHPRDYHLLASLSAIGCSFSSDSLRSGGTSCKRVYASC